MKKLFTLCFFLINFTAISTATNANSVTAVNSHTCGRVKNASQPFMLVLKPGEELAQALVRYSKDANLAGASISGLGTIINPTLGYYHTNTHSY